MKLSIVVPIYGVEKTLAKCLDSILMQTFGDYEVILVDDGSRDGCPAIVDEYEAKNPRIVAVHKPNGGYSSAMNRGIEMAQGEWIGIVEPDDWIEPDMYERLMAAAGDKVDVVKANFSWTSADGHSTPFDRQGKNPPTTPFKITEAPFFFGEHPSIWTGIYRASFLREKAIRFAEAPGASWTDNLFQVQTMYLARAIMYVDVAVYHYYYGGLLRNMMTPFVRSHEIHDWLDSQGVRDAALWNCLYFREMWYIRGAFDVAKGKKSVWGREALRLIARWNRAYIDTGVGLSTKDATCVRSFAEHPFRWALKKRTCDMCRYWLRLIFYPIVVATRPVRHGRKAVK